jgi:uncharacterized membrane protein YdjX (TVP38/TMEM64 family)
MMTQVRGGGRGLLLLLLLLLLLTLLAPGCHGFVLPSPRPPPSRLLRPSTTARFLLGGGGGGGGGGNGGADADAAAVESMEELWGYREGFVQGSFEALLTCKDLLREPEPEEGDEEREEVSSTKQAFVASAVAVVFGAFVLRLGGRAALVSLLGLDFVAELDIGSQIDQVVQTADALGPLTVIAFVLAWVVAKTFFLDFLSVALALYVRSFTWCGVLANSVISPLPRPITALTNSLPSSASGIIFGGVIQGALLSATGATIGSLVGFQLSRTLLQEKVEESVQKQPVARALRKVVEDEGFKTVFVLRLSPLLPIPLGAYSFIYGTVPNLSPWVFAPATFLGSIKPYLLDSYLGVFSKQVVDGADLDGAKDAILLVGLGALVLIGTFATDLAGESWDKVQAEMQADEEARAAVLAAGGEVEEDPPQGWGNMVGPFNTTGAATALAAAAPAGSLEELGDVWETMTSFCEVQWPEGVRRAAAAKEERDALEQSAESKKRSAEAADKRFGAQVSGEWNAAVLRSEQEGEEEGEKQQKGGASGGGGGAAAAAAAGVGEGGGEYGDEDRRALALWVLDGPQPWRPLLTNLLFTFSVLRVLSNKWSVEVKEVL